MIAQSLVIRNQVTMTAAIIEMSLEVLYILTNLWQFRGAAMTELSDLQYGINRKLCGVNGTRNLGADITL